jgi:hypothetical protein
MSDAPITITIDRATATNLFLLLDGLHHYNEPTICPETIAGMKDIMEAELGRQGLWPVPQQSEPDYSREDATQGEYDADNAWLRSAGWGEM